MARRFRLLSAAGGFERRDVASERPAIASNFLSVEFSQKPASRAVHPWVSVVIGKNGVGKSRMLAGIADVFESLDRGRTRRRRDDLTLSTMAFVCDGDLCEIEVDQTAHIQARLNGHPCALDEVPLPTRVIALTTTPFDKFRISRSLLRMPGKEEPDTPERYAYLGLRDRTGRASPTAAIFRSLEGLFEASSSAADRRLKIAEVFGFLGYKPHVEVRYEFSHQSMHIFTQLMSGSLPESFQERTQSRTFRSPLERMLERDFSVIEELRQVGSEALDRANGSRSFTLRADFAGYSSDDAFFRRVQILRKADLMRMRAAEVERVTDGAVLDLKLASSGELGIVTGFLGLASMIEDGSLIFIDEPEISLHPEWQTRYIDLLLRTFGHFSGCHFVLATHSPLILADIAPDNSNVVSLDPDRRDAESPEQFSGQSTDYLLFAAFNVAGKNNLYLKQRTIQALRLAADGQAGSDEYWQIMDELTRLLPNLGSESPLAKLILELRSAGEAEPVVQ